MTSPLPEPGSIALALQTLPPVEWNNGSSGFQSFSSLPKSIFLHSAFASTRDTDGLTLIPPSAEEFATTFVKDLNSLLGDGWALETIDEIHRNASGIFLGSYSGSPDDLTYANGEPTTEGYEIVVQSGHIFIGGSGARGMWWGTRTLLQQMVQSESISIGKIVDAPAYETRGYMLDAGRKWYAPSTLKELCTYASWFKMSEFHYHASDNYPLSRGHNETWYEVYSHFSFMPESVELRSIIERANETLSRAVFEDLQMHCAQRGVTIIPEIEAPGHCLAITKWKPDLALAKKDLLNLSHPDSIPTVQAIWSEFLPWFQTKEVHIGADEYDSDLADDYIRFVNSMSQFVNSTAGKRIRIWGTYEPSKNFTISNDITIQHWQYGQSDPVQLDRSSYNIINSEDWWAYVTLKNDHMPILPAAYPQLFNTSRILNFGNQPDVQWEPSLYNPVNNTEQLPSASPNNRGAIMAAWNDNGPDATTQLEAFYAIRSGLPIVASRAWSGSRGTPLDISSLAESNLDRNILGVNNSDCTQPLISWTAPKTRNETYELGYGSKGLNNTLTMDATGPFTLRSNDSMLTLRGDGMLIYTADGYEYPLRSVASTDGYDSGHPGRIWTNVTTSTHEIVHITVPSRIQIQTDRIGGSRVWVDGQFKGRFEVFVYGGRNKLFSWSQMAFVTPLQELEGAAELPQHHVVDKNIVLQNLAHEGTSYLNKSAEPDLHRLSLGPP
ncbi:family 20 glycosyl hydrolase [Pseudovirgaria hyperparasitica]|uniref:beta-N-acetylhexosaminidase n=1 Tax=Pseudovirgaria hyperparasitica TaxID=470096 RepID=A0A6A6W3S1_9PEZI|nr:family 20 glycosyl hydrolase [Pseudovirgaria hyperparasitica]KAF2756799.1 family 20 glycosyl hydrolase [Pseudovirgaria hyperparasitica]